MPKPNPRAHKLRTGNAKFVIKEKSKIENPREAINTIRKKMEIIKENKTATPAQKELALKILRKNIKTIQEKLSNSKTPETPEIKRFKENVKKAFRK
ncbi:hypothetical protein GW835_02805 [archaeon]|nr:hypothetical protein [archaeon]NCP79471.1 hypothetical protein [archaeon]NCP97414.1 hypothetical protein [archaeon]NCQ07238.1 hypothetical protein [archaeon]NCQ51034.1 hypothetical protein [archaeon]